MTMKAAFRALNTTEKRTIKFQPISKWYNLGRGFVDWCETRNEELLMNTGSIA
jgi:hypothetical protein